MTFFITRPPLLTASPRPLTKRTPSMASRQAPACTRRGPEAEVATMPPTVGSPSVVSRKRWSMGSKGRRWPSLASVSSTSATGVPALTTRVSAPGS